MFHILQTGWPKRYLPLPTGQQSPARRRLITFAVGVALLISFVFNWNPWGAPGRVPSYSTAPRFPEQPQFFESLISSHSQSLSPSLFTKVSEPSHPPPSESHLPSSPESSTVQDSDCPRGTDFPPAWDTIREYERHLPQHDLDLPAPEGRNGRYVYFKSQVQMLGWNNQLNEVLMNAYLAYKSNRSYVFQDCIWTPEHYPWPKEKYRDNEWNPRTPANALMSGPAVGGPWPPGDPAPRSVSEAFFDQVCPPSKRRIINTRDVKKPIWGEDALTIFNTWRTILYEASDPCIEIQPPTIEEDRFPQVFDLFLWGSERILAIWQDFRDSPVSRLLGTSPIVKAAVDRNEYLFDPRDLRTSIPYSIDPYDRMLAVHIRRGDFKEACLSLANWNSTFYSWNLLPDLPDKFVNPPGDYEVGHNSPENIEVYLEHCLPTDKFLIDKIRKSKEDFEGTTDAGGPRKLDVLFLMTNDQSQWLDDFKLIMKGAGWHTVVTTKDLRLTDEQMEVGMAVDMDIARKAAVFIGNGWSSFTSNIVHRRLVDGREARTIRFY